MTFINLAPPEFDSLFYVSNYGVIYLMEDLSNITVQQVYRFNVRVTDGRQTNTGETEATITITVRPLEGPPEFTGTPYSTTVFINQAVNSTFFRVSAIDTDLRVCLLFYSLKPDFVMHLDS